MIKRNENLHEETKKLNKTRKNVIRFPLVTGQAVKKLKPPPGGYPLSCYRPN